MDNPQNISFQTLWKGSMTLNQDSSNRKSAESAHPVGDYDALRDEQTRSLQKLQSLVVITPKRSMKYDW